MKEELKVSEMIEANNINDEDEIMILQDSINKKIKMKNIKKGIEVGTGGDSTPIGSIFMYASNTIPSKWLLCNGQEINREEYSNLFSIIGTTYGEGDGETTFNLPNLKGRVPVGIDDNDYDFDVLGKTGGEKEHTLTINEMPEHAHQMGSDHNTFGAGSYPNDRLYDGTNFSTKETGGGQAHNNLQPYIVLNYIIKAR